MILTGSVRSFLVLLLLAVLTVTCDSNSSGDAEGPNPPVEPAPTLPDESQAAALAFTNVNVVSMESEAVAANQTVVIRDGLIAEIGPVDDIALAPDVVVLPGEGAYLMPGLSDMHVHLTQSANAVSDLFLFAAHGVTAVRVMWGNAQIRSWRNQADLNRIDSPRLYVTSPGFEGATSFFPGSILFNSPEEGRNLVRQQRLSGYNFIKMFNNVGLESYLAILDEANQVGIKVVGHLPTFVPFETALAAGQYSFEHLFAFSRGAMSSGNIFNGTIDPVKLSSLAQTAQASGAWFCPTIVVNTLTPADAASFTSTPESQLVSAPMLSFFQTGPWQGLNNAALAVSNYRQITKALIDANANVILGTDAGFGYQVPGITVHQELQLLVDAGLTPFQALQTATVNAARFLETDTFGMIATGKIADLILVQGNPLEDIEQTDRRVGVMMRGHWRSEQRLQQLLDQLRIANE